MDDDRRVIKTYVWHGEDCYFVSTINRDSSSMYGGRFAETLVWHFDWAKNKRLNLTGWMMEDCEGCIRGHQAMVNRIHSTGSGAEPEESP